MQSRRLRGLALLGALAALGVVLVPTGGAKPPASDIKKYDACLQYIVSPSCPTPGAHTSLPAGSKAELLLTITNQLSSNQTLGSANLDAPPELPIDTSTVAYDVGSGTFGTNTSSQIQLRNLNLAPGGFVRVKFEVTTPCSGSGLPWTISAKQSNNFLGTGNDHNLDKSTGLVSDIVGGCRLLWVTQPASTNVNTTITGTSYDANGPNVAVRAVDGAGDTIISATGTVTLTKTAGSFTSPGAFTGIQAALEGGVATFGGLKSSGPGFDFALQASSSGYVPSPDSGPFQITLGGTDCTIQQGGCQTDPLVVNNTTFIQAQTEADDFVFIGIAPLGLVGCPGHPEFESVGAEPLVVIDQRASLSGDLFVTYGIKKTLIQKKYGNTQGEQFLPICAGSQRIRLNDAGSTEAVRCDEDYNGTDQAGTGWMGKALDANGKFDQTQLAQATCDTASGYFVGVLGSFQDYTSSNPDLVIDPNSSPTVVGWSSDNTYRYFTIRYPEASGGGVFADVPWDGWQGG